jgi:hypothetical protein
MGERMWTRAVTVRVNDIAQIFAGAVGGVVSGFVCAPMELVMIQQQRFGQCLLGIARPRLA